MVLSGPTCQTERHTHHTTPRNGWIVRHNDNKRMTHKSRQRTSESKENRQEGDETLTKRKKEEIKWFLLVGLSRPSWSSVGPLLTLFLSLSRALSVLCPLRPVPSLPSPLFFLRVVSLSFVPAYRLVASSSFPSHLQPINRKKERNRREKEKEKEGGETRAARSPASLGMSLGATWTT